MTATNMRTLGRLGEPLRSSPGFRRRRRIGRPVAVILAVTIVVLGWLGITANSQVPYGTSLEDVTTATAPTRPAAAASRSAAVSGSDVVFASADGLRLSLVHGTPIAIAFHEADRSEALPLLPLGQLLDNANPTYVPLEDTSGPAYSVLAPAKSARPATGAVDVVVPEGAAVLAPVSGRVAAVTEYPLFGGTHDWRIVIEPNGRPDLAVSLRYLADPVVAVGDEVTAGDTPLAAARVLPFTSPVDTLADASLPRVSLQVRPAVATEAIDPNAPAVSAEDATGT